MEHGQRFFGICHRRTLDGLCAWRRTERARYSRVFPGDAPDSPAGGLLSAVTARNESAFRDAVQVAGCLRGDDLVELAVLVWETEFVVGAGRRRADDVQRQRGTNQHVSRKPRRTAETAQYSRLVGPYADRVLPGPTGRSRVCRYAFWFCWPIRSIALSAAIH